MKSFVRMVAGMALALAAMAANAQAPDTGFYVGGSIGQSQIRFDDSTLQVAGATSSSISKDETDTTWKAFVGYRLGRHLAVEGGYADFGKFSATNTVSAPANGSLSVSFKASGPFVDAVGILPFGDFSLFGKAGVVYSTAKGSATTTGAVVTTGNANQSSSEFNFKAGIGAGYDFTRNFGVRVELEQVFAVGDKDKTGEGDIRLFTVGGVFRF